MRSEKLWKQNLRYIPNGTQTYSKTPNRYLDGVYPLMIQRGDGCNVFDYEGNAYVDYPCSLGTNILGHANPIVNEAVKQRIDKGILFSQPNGNEGILADQISKIIPSMQSMRFLKSGSEACSAAIRIARAYTQRDIIIQSGYHGWHDAFNARSKRASGIPIEMQNNMIDIPNFDLDALKDALQKYHGVAAYILEPATYQEAPEGFLEKAIKLCHKFDVLVIFDEVVTGIRWSNFAVQNYEEVRPDITCLGKGLANGFPMACVGGNRKIMQVVEDDAFVSSTYGGELASINAAIATLNICVSESVPEKLFSNGEELKQGYQSIARQLEIQTHAEGHPCHSRFIFPSVEHKALFWQECLKLGVLFGDAQFVSFSHTPAVVDFTLGVIRKSLEYCKKHWSDPKSVLISSPPEPVFAIAARR